MTYLLFLDNLMDINEQDSGWTQPNNKETIELWEKCFNFVSSQIEGYVFDFLSHKKA